MDDLSELEFGRVGFSGEELTGVLGVKPLGVMERINNKFYPHMVSKLGLKCWATLLGSQCSRLHMGHPDSPPTYPSPICWLQTRSEVSFK